MRKPKNHSEAVIAVIGEVAKMIYEGDQRTTRRRRRFKNQSEVDHHMDNLAELMGHLESYKPRAGTKRIVSARDTHELLGVWVNDADDEDRYVVW